MVEKARSTAISPPGWPKEADKWNYAYAKLLEIRRQAGEIIHWWYEPFSIWLPGGVRFKPDYMVWEANNTITIVEVKGWSKNLRDGKARYKIAASLFPCWTWKMVTKKSNQWEEMT